MPPRDLSIQDVFDRLDQHLRSGALPSISDNGVTCYYRHPSGDGRKCFAGLFIPDEKYEPSMEGRPVATLLFTSDPDDRPLPDMPPGFWGEVQDVHDLFGSRYCGVFGNYEIWRAMARDTLADLAAKYGAAFPR